MLSVLPDAVAACRTGNKLRLNRCLFKLGLSQCFCQPAGAQGSTGVEYRLHHMRRGGVGSVCVTIFPAQMHIHLVCRRDGEDLCVKYGNIFNWVGIGLRLGPK